MRYSWPGNIRELENSIEYALAMSKSETMRSTDFPFHILSGNIPPKPGGKPENQKDLHPVLKGTVEKHDDKEKTPILRLSGPTPEEEKEAILSALNRYFGNRDLAARSLGISRVSLWRKMKKHGLSGWKYQKDL